MHATDFRRAKINYMVNNGKHVVRMQNPTPILQGVYDDKDAMRVPWLQNKIIYAR